MQKELSKPVVIGLAIAGVVALAVIVFFLIKSSSGGDLSDKTFKPVPFSPPGGVRPGMVHGAAPPTGSGKS